MLMCYIPFIIMADNYNYYKLVDPKFDMMVTITKLLGLIAMELADQLFLPLGFDEYVVFSSSALFVSLFLHLVLR